MICNNLTNKEGTLYFNGYNTLYLAKKYGTPLYVMDEDRIHQNIRVYKDAMNKYFGEGSFPLYASKAASFKQIYRIAKEEDIGIDVVSMGEIFTAKSVGFPMHKAYFHSNNKTEEDIRFAMDSGVGYFVVDCFEELQAIDNISKEKGIIQNVLLRLTPGIDPHTYEAVATGKVDSKFGSAIETGQAEQITEFALSLKHICLKGFHCHIGSQIFDSSIFIKGSEIMLQFICDMKKKYNYVTEQLDLGGGFGVRYTDSDPIIDIEKEIETVSKTILDKASELGISVPQIRMEPGRSIVADAGLTLYTVGSVKRIPGYKNYVSIDGGMTDNPRFALYKSKYTVLNAGKLNDTKVLKADLVGRCCESGDIIQKDVDFANTQKGDIVAVLTTGAYNYSMASNYNRICRPAVVMVGQKGDYIAVKRESLEYLTENDL